MKRKLISLFIILSVIITTSNILCFKCPPISSDSGQAIAAGNNEVFDQIVKCSYEFVQDISTNQSTLYTGFNSDNFKTKLQLYNGKLFGAWAFTSYHNSIWWCYESNLLMATYIGVSGPGIEYLWRLFLNEHQSSSSSSSQNYGSVCGGVDIVLGDAKLSAEFIDGVVIIALPKDVTRMPVIKEVSMNFFPHANTLHDSIRVFESSKKHLLTTKMKKFIKSSLAENLLPAIEISIRKGLNKCLPLIKKLMSGFDGNNSNSNQTSQPNRIKNVILKLQHSRTTLKRSAINEFKELRDEMLTRNLMNLKKKYENFEHRAQLLLASKTPLSVPKPEVKAENETQNFSSNCET